MKGHLPYKDTSVLECPLNMSGEYVWGICVGDMCGGYVWGTYCVEL